MSIQKEGSNRSFKPQYIRREREAKTEHFGDRDRNRSFSRDRGHYRQNFRPNYRRQSQDRQDNRRGSYRCQNYGTRGDSRDRGRDKVNYRRDLSNDRYSSRDRYRSRMRERHLTPRRDDRRYQSPRLNLGPKNRSTSTTRDRITCYKCSEYDHFCNECPNSVMDDSDGYESDIAPLQLITAEAEIHDNLDGTRLNEEQTYLNL